MSDNDADCLTMADEWHGLKRGCLVIKAQIRRLAAKMADFRLEHIRYNAEQTAALPERDMLLARLVLNGHLITYKRGPARLGVMDFLVWWLDV